ncbi:MAG: hydroxymethylglutaryl-CoA lyase [Rhodobacteraceae bacterium]|nr:hydroxymethylglutaryl-CoA lyase [Paracoccaceae bacterium]MCY4327468.1 hydroxymethylglutaryl-CoA lyase [Paracoccaceae bacterium]
MGESVSIVEVGPRDGLQNEKKIIPTDQKIKLVDELARCGLKRIEATSFVSPDWVPQLADAVEVMDEITRTCGVSFSVLVPNLKGMELAIKCQADEVAIFTSASEGFCQRNINCSISESLNRFKPVLDLAGKSNLPVRGYVSCVIDCPYDGPVDPTRVASVCVALLTLGCREIGLGDTIGTGTPRRIDAMLKSVLDVIPAHKLAGHYHNTNGHALDCIKVSLAHGLRVFDSAVGGLGGCPYAPGAAGNVATEEVVQLLRNEGYETGIDLDRLKSVARPLAQAVRREQ